jgi:hypothetical protein
MATYLPFSDVIAAYGYRQPPPMRPRGSSYLLALAYVIMGAALGTVAGTSLAMASYHPSNLTYALQAEPSVQASSTVENVVTPPPPSSVLTKPVVAEPVSVTPSSPLKLAKASMVITHHRSITPTQRNLHKQAELPTAAAREANRTPVSVEEPVLPTVLDTGTTNYRFFTEGDATVADFDASAGRIETYEGRTFVIGATAAASALDSLQDSGSSLHYRCDQNGDCTLMSAGLVMQNVRLL